LGKALSQTAKANEKIDALQNRMEGKEQLNKVLSSGLSEKVQWISDISTEKEKELENFKNTYESLVKTLGDEVKRGEIKISRAVDSLLVKIVDKILFASGKTTIKKSGREVLQKIGDVLENVKNRQIMIKGHTDNVPIGKKIKEKFPSNWELSAMRAINVVHYLKEKVGISPETLSATGYSKFRPVATNDSAEGRAQNRRIEIALLPLDVNKVLKDLEN
jgi:chemotaxis protein MotB